MYETEANGLTELMGNLPGDVAASFGAWKGEIVARTVLPWGEHCTECVWPTCYQTCELYSPREDGRCRRFIDGMVRIPCPEAVNGYVLRIRFKRWAKLWAAGRVNLFKYDRAKQIESRDYQFGKLLFGAPLPRVVKSEIISKRYGFKKRKALRKRMIAAGPTSFAVECFNPTDRSVMLSVAIRSAQKGQGIPFEAAFQIQPGYQCLRIPVSQIGRSVDLAAPISVDILPSAWNEETTLYFGLMDFVQESESRGAGGGKIKCVVWDLDNTLWNGVLVEDGADKVVLKPGIADVIDTLDRRGIVQSIASKNHHDEAMEALKRFGLDEYFLCPQISWSPKGEAVRTIARRLNIGMDTVLFVDDQEFERYQVKSSVPQARLLDAKDYLGIPNLPECQVPVTADGRNRRKLYQLELERDETREAFKDDYLAFLKHCEMRMSISHLTDENLERVHELTQRTNQMNFSGNRYERQILRSIMRTDHLDTFVLSCEDRFGSYGIVGFAIVDKREPRMTDLMFSCRVQAKRVEHAFLTWAIERYNDHGSRNFYADYRETPRNAPSGKVFEDIGMLRMSEMDGITSLVYAKGRAVPNDQLIRIETIALDHTPAGS